MRTKSLQNFEARSNVKSSLILSVTESKVVNSHLSRNLILKNSELQNEMKSCSVFTKLSSCTVQSNRNLFKMTETFTEPLERFTTADYSVFALMLIVCSGIGLYFGYKDHVKHKASKVVSRSGSDALNYLLGGKNVQVFPGRFVYSYI